MFFAHFPNSYPLLVSTSHKYSIVWGKFQAVATAERQHRVPSPITATIGVSKKLTATCLNSVCSWWLELPTCPSAANWSISSYLLSPASLIGALVRIIQGVKGCVWVLALCSGASALPIFSLPLLNSKQLNKCKWGESVTSWNSGTLLRMLLNQLWGYIWKYVCFRFKLLFNW